ISLPAVSFAICSFSICLSRFMANSPSAARQTARGPAKADRVARASTLPDGICHASGTHGLSRLCRILPCPGIAFPPIPPALFRQPFGLGAPPGSDFGVIAGKKDLRDLPPVPRLRACVLGVFQ